VAQVVQVFQVLLQEQLLSMQVVVVVLLTAYPTLQVE
jgi:hypothetical protein